MIVGTWHVLFAGTFYCPLNVSLNGSITPGNCSAPASPTATIQRPPTGVLSIDSSCHITGTMSYTYFDPVLFSPQPVTWNLTLILFRSTDGSRLSGSALYSTKSIQTTPFYNALDFIAQ